MLLITRTWSSWDQVRLKPNESFKDLKSLALVNTAEQLGSQRDWQSSGNSYQLRRRATPAHVCASDNTIYTFKARCLAGERMRNKCQAGCFDISRWHHRQVKKKVTGRSFLSAHQKWKQHSPPAPRLQKSFGWICCSFKCLSSMSRPQLHVSTTLRSWTIRASWRVCSCADKWTQWTKTPASPLMSPRWREALTKSESIYFRVILHTHTHTLWREYLFMSVVNYFLHSFVSVNNSRSGDAYFFLFLTSYFLL